MSTETNPADDEYLQLEKRLGGQEQELAASLAEADRTLDAATEHSLQRFKTLIDQLDAKAAAKRGAAREQTEAAASDARRSRQALLDRLAALHAASGDRRRERKKEVDAARIELERKLGALSEQLK
jgi:hypothetical protein